MTKLAKEACMKNFRFDTLDYAKRAKEHGYTEQQAEFQAEEMAKLVDEAASQLATKKDLKHALTHLYIKLLLAMGGGLVGTIIILDALLKH